MLHRSCHLLIFVNLEYTYMPQFENALLYYHHDHHTYIDMQITWWSIRVVYMYIDMIYTNTPYDPNMCILSYVRFLLYYMYCHIMYIIYFCVPMYCAFVSMDLWKERPPSPAAPKPCSANVQHETWEKLDAHCSTAILRHQTSSDICEIDRDCNSAHQVSI